MDSSSTEPVRLVSEPPPPHSVDDRSGWLSDLVGEVATEIQGDAGPRLTLIAADAFARLGRGLGAQRIVLHRVEAGRGRLSVAHEWAEAGLVPLRTFQPSLGLDEVPWALNEIGAADVLVDRAGAVSALLRAGTVVAFPLIGERGVASVLSVHFREEESQAALASRALVRTLGVLLWSADRTVVLLDRPGADELTGLANRKLLLVSLGRSLARVGRGTTSGVAVVACQLSGGADARSTDEQVARVGQSLDRHTRESDLVALFDRRSLVVLCDDVPGPHEAEAEARRLREVVLGGVRELGVDQRAGSGQAPVLPASWRADFGVAHARTRVPPGVLLRQADSAAYLAAASGEPVRLAES